MDPREPRCAHTSPRALPSWPCPAWGPPPAPTETHTAEASLPGTSASGGTAASRHPRRGSRWAGAPRDSPPLTRATALCGSSHSARSRHSSRETSSQPRAAGLGLGAPRSEPGPGWVPNPSTSLRNTQPEESGQPRGSAVRGGRRPRPGPPRWAKPPPAGPARPVHRVHEAGASADAVSSACVMRVPHAPPASLVPETRAGPAARETPYFQPRGAPLTRRLREGCDWTKHRGGPCGPGAGGGHLGGGVHSLPEPMRSPEELSRILTHRLRSSGTPRRALL